MTPRVLGPTPPVIAGIARTFTGDVLEQTAYTVWDTVASTPATIYSDPDFRNKISSPSTDANGKFEFYVPNGSYEISITHDLADNPEPFTMRGVGTNSGGPSGSSSIALSWKLASDFAATSVQKAVFGNHGFNSVPLSTYYPNLSAAQAHYPHATSVNDELDWAILQAAVTGTTAVGDPTVGIRLATSWLTIDAGLFLLNRYLEWKSLQNAYVLGMGQSRTKFVASVADINSLIRLNGVSYSIFGGFGVTGTTRAVNGVSIQWITAESYGNSTNLTINDVLVDGSFENGFAVGTENPVQNDGITFRKCTASGQYDGSTTTKWQKGFALGTGAAGNTLDVHLQECGIAGYKDGLNSGGVNFHVKNFQCANNSVDFHTTTPGGECSIESGRSEGAQRLYVGDGPSSAGGLVALRDIFWESHNLHLDGRWVICAGPGLLMENVSCGYSPRIATIHGSSVKAQIQMNQPGGGVFSIIKCSAPETLDDFISAGPPATGVVLSYGYIDNTGSVADIWAFRLYGRVPPTTLQPDSSSNTPLTIRGLAGQTGDLLKFLSSGAVPLMWVGPEGGVHIRAQGSNRTAPPFALDFTDNSNQPRLTLGYDAAATMIQMVAPDSSLVSQFDGSNGSFKISTYKNMQFAAASGATIDFAVADGFDMVVIETAGVTFRGGSDSTRARFQAIAGQTANITDHRTNTGVVLFAVTATGALELPEQSDPTAPATNNARIYARDNGSGKTQVCVRFPTGAVQVLATEP